LLLASYALLLTRLITDARRSRDRTGMLVIMAIVGGLIFQISLNVGMAVGLLPVIGVPLPLMSAASLPCSRLSSQSGFAISVQLRRFVN
jgi:rod shape determining protein RodA